MQSFMRMKADGTTKEKEREKKTCLHSGSDRFKKKMS